MKNILLLLCFWALAQAVPAQSIQLNRVYHLENDARLESMLLDYLVVQGDVSAFLQAYKNEFSYIALEKGPRFELNLEPVEVLAKDYQLTVLNNETVTVSSRRSSDVKTFRGTVENHRISLTVAPDFLQGRLVDADGVEYYIEPAKTLLPDAPASSFLVYKTADVVDDPNAICGYTATKEQVEYYENHVREQAGSQSQRAGECLDIKLAIASLSDMYVLRGSSVAATQNFIAAIINDLNIDYETVFDYDVNFSIVANIVSENTTTSLDLAIGAEDRSTLIIDAFKTWAEGVNGFTVDYDLGNIWTARDIYNLDNMGNPNYNVVGTALTPGICNPGNNYAVFESFSTTAWQLRVLQSHETGHNFSMLHDVTVNPNIMFPSVVNTSTWTAGSIAELTAWVDGNFCLQSSSIPLTGSPYPDFTLNGMCKDESRTPVDKSARLPTSYTWTSTGATITNGSTSTPTISYTTSGTKSINLSVSNANCSAFAVVGTKTIEVVDQVAPTTACAISNTNTTTGGTYNFGLLNVSFGTVNNNTGYPDQDGAYSNFTCQEFATVSDLSVPFSFTVGTNSGAFHRIKVFVDVNNNGIFDSGEELYNNPNVSASSTITPTIILPNTTLTNTLLRVRVSVAANNRDACTVPTFGEVEDYGLILSAPLPVEMTSLATAVKGRDVSVLWSVQQEIDVDKYLVEHSRDGNNWQAVGSVLATNIPDAQDYEFLHGRQASGTHYYRVRSFDFDGSINESEVVSARVNDALGFVALAPNPTQNGWSTLTIDRGFATGSLSIFDGLGRLLSLKPLLPSAEQTKEVLIDLSAQPQGAYWIVLNLDGEQTSIRLIK